jgi:MYXO-CTERM domain-containing protein
MARHGWRVRTLAIALTVATLLPVAAALGDGDPASDVLLGENVFYPYSPPVTGSLQKTLNAATAAAKRGGFPIKVALIGSPVDLGVIPDLFGAPQKYAEFLDQEISFRTRQPLLVVMAAGYGVEGLPARASAAARSLPRPKGKAPSDLAAAAITAVAKLAEASGHPITGVPGLSSASGNGGSGSTTVIVAALALAALAVATALVVLRRRERAPSP